MHDIKYDKIDENVSVNSRDKRSSKSCAVLNMCGIATIIATCIVIIGSSLIFGVIVKREKDRCTPIDCNIMEKYIINTTCNNNNYIIQCYMLKLDICTTTNTCNNVQYNYYENYDLASNFNQSKIICYLVNDPQLYEPDYTNASMVGIVILAPITVLAVSVLLTSLAFFLVEYSNPELCTDSDDDD